MFPRQNFSSGIFLFYNSIKYAKILFFRRKFSVIGFQITVRRYRCGMRAARCECREPASLAVFQSVIARCKMKTLIMLSVYSWKIIRILRIDSIDKELNYFCSTDKCPCHTSQIGKSHYQ